LETDPSPAAVPTIILCGGRGSRIADAYPLLPKPLVPVGGRPILWHIMKIYAAAGYRDFALALGWMGDEIRRFFLHYEALTSDFRIELGTGGSIEFLDDHPDQGWKITCLDTGVDTLTGGRVKRAAARLRAERLMVTYGDCVGDVDVGALVEYHEAQGLLATVTAVQPPSRFGELQIGDEGRVRAFVEKPQTSTGSINGGFMVLEREAIDKYIPSDQDVMLEREPLARLAADGQLAAYPHPGFWLPMDTARERTVLEDLWSSGEAPWRLWG
jgi:glucose-1-phosphate cytidylyltransferase